VLALIFIFVLFEYTVMRVLLLWPPTTVYGGDTALPPVVQPLYLSYLAAWLEKEGHEVSIIDGRGSRQNITQLGTSIRYGLSDEKVLHKVKNYYPDIIGISSMWTVYSGDSHQLAKLIKGTYPHLKIIFGRLHPSDFPELVLEDKYMDLVFEGETADFNDFKNQISIP